MKTFVFNLANVILIFFAVTQQASAHEGFSHFTDSQWGNTWRPKKVQPEAFFHFKKAPAASLEATRLTLKKSFHVVDETDKSYAIATSIIDAVYAGYKLTYPKLMKNKEIPHFLIIDADLAANFAYGLGDAYNGNVHSGVLVLSREMLIAGSMTWWEKAFIVAHELAHFYLTHRGFTHSTYLSAGFADREMSTFEREQFDQWFFLSKAVGTTSTAQTSSLGIPAFKSILASQLEGITKTANVYAGPACKRAFAIRNSYITSINESHNALTWTYTLPDNYADLSAKFIAALDACGTDEFVGDHTMFKKDASLTINGQTFNAEQILSRILGPATFDLGHDSHFTILANALRASNEKLADIEAQLPLDEVRYYSTEDQADEVAALVLKKMKEYEKLPTKSFELSGTEVILRVSMNSEDDKLVCKQWISEGVMPAYGDLNVVYHSGCFRYLNMNLFTKFYDSYLDLQ